MIETLLLSSLVTLSLVATFRKLPDTICQYLLDRPLLCQICAGIVIYGTIAGISSTYKAVVICLLSELQIDLILGYVNKRRKAHVRV